MLFCYSLAATAENWLHECLVRIVSSALQTMNEGNAPSPWPDCIPDEYRQSICNRDGLKNRYEKFCRTAQTLKTTHRTRILDAIHAQNDHPAIFGSKSLCVSLAELPKQVLKPAHELFDFAFSLLKDLGVRDRHYEIIYDNIPGRVCPFCGCEYFDAPTAPRHDLDHYLPISKYPFAGVNLRNLVPMGDRCNSAYKGRTDILTDAKGNRRRCFDPYGGVCGSLSLIESRPFEGEDSRLPKWEVDLGQSPESQTWDEIWQIKSRYVRSVLNPEFFHWLEHFAQWCRATQRTPGTRSEVLKALNDYINGVIQEGFADRAFIKKAVFEMLKAKASSGPYAERVTHFIGDLASADRGAAA